MITVFAFYVDLCYNICIIGSFKSFFTKISTRIVLYPLVTYYHVNSFIGGFIMMWILCSLGILVAFVLTIALLTLFFISPTLEDFKNSIKFIVNNAIKNLR